MNDFDITFDPRAKSKFSAINERLVDAARDTLNEMAMIGAEEQRKHIPRVFTVRNKWVLNSIWPKLGKKRGLVPTWARDVSKMYSRTGSISPLLQKQEEGFTKNDPTPPSNEARVTRSHKRIIRKKFRLKHIDRNRTLRPSKAMGDIADHKERISVLLAVAAAINWKGLILVEKDGKLPAGYYQRRGAGLHLVRRIQKGTKRRRSIKWHEDSIKNSRLNTRAQGIYNQNAHKHLSRLL